MIVPGLRTRKNFIVLPMGISKGVRVEAWARPPSGFLHTLSYTYQISKILPFLVVIILALFFFALHHKNFSADPLVLLKAVMCASTKYIDGVSISANCQNICAVNVSANEKIISAVSLSVNCRKRF